MAARSWASLRQHARDPVYANALALVANSGIVSLLGFAFWLLVARRFDAATIGVGAAVVSAATLAALLGKAGFDAAVVRYAPSASPRALRKLLVQATLASLLLTAAVAGVFLALAARHVEALAPLASPGATAGFLLLACGTAFGWMLDAYFLAEQRAVLTLGRNVAFSGVKLVAPLLVAGAFAIPLAWGAGLLASLVVAIPFVVVAARAHRVERPVSPTRAGVVGYAARTYVLHVAEFLPGLLLPILVLDALGATANARFYLAWTIATVGFLASKSVAQSAFAALVRPGSAISAIGKGARFSLLVLAPFALLLLAGADVLLGIFGQTDAQDAALVLRLLALSLAPVAVTNLYLSLLKARDVGWELTVLPAVTLVVLVAGAPLALAFGGMAAVGALWLVVQLLAGAYSGVRLLVVLRRTSHATRTGTTVGRRAHEG